MIAARSAVAAPEKIDYFWDKLAADRGEPNVCGWLRDKFRLPWQIVPSQIWDWLNGDDPNAVQRVTSKVGASRSCEHNQTPARPTIDKAPLCSHAPPL